MHNIPISCTSSPCNLLFLNLGVYGLVQATVGVGTVLIWYFAVAYTRGRGAGGCGAVCSVCQVPPVELVAACTRATGRHRTFLRVCVRFPKGAEGTPFRGGWWGVPMDRCIARLLRALGWCLPLYWAHVSVDSVGPLPAIEMLHGRVCQVRFSPRHRGPGAMSLGFCRSVCQPNQRRWPAIHRHLLSIVVLRFPMLRVCGSRTRHCNGGGGGASNCLRPEATLTGPEVGHRSRGKHGRTNLLLALRPTRIS